MEIIKTIINRIKSPCSRCPYSQGLIKTLVNPCPQCRHNGYRTYENFKKKCPVKIRKDKKRKNNKRKDKKR